MRRIIIIVSLLLTLVMLGGCLGCSVFSKREPYHSDEELEAEYGYRSLTDEEKEFYRKVDAYIYAPQSLPFTASRKLELDRMSEIIDIFISDHPEIFWIDEEYNFETIGYVGDKYLISLDYAIENDVREAGIDAMKGAVESFLKTVPEGADDYEKELCINSWIIENCMYDDEAAEQEAEQNVYAVGHEHMAYGVLVDGKAVCDGYARAFKLLCDKVGLECVIISGDTEDSAHAWNAVKIMDSWYYVDVTWNDNDDFEDCEAERYLYLNMTEEMISADHVLAPLYSDKGDYEAIFYNYYLPECDSEEYNYFERTYFKVSSEDELSLLPEKIAEAAKEKADCFCFSVSDDLNYNDLFRKLYNGDAWDLLRQANSINGGDPQLNVSPYLFQFPQTRGILLLLEYV